MKEIEKKYLVEILPKMGNVKRSRISQGYLSTENGEIRIRMTDEECFLTEKGDGTLEREENETPISVDAFKILYNMVKGRMIEKTRFFVPLYDGHTAEFDVYHGEFAGLMTVEVEFESVEDAENFIPPYWFSRDVTEDKRFKNKNLATSNITVGELLREPGRGRELK